MLCQLGVMKVMENSSFQYFPHFNGKFGSEIPTYSIAPDESSGVELFNKSLQFRPDTQVRVNPFHVARVATAGPRDMEIMYRKQSQDLGFRAFSMLFSSFFYGIYLR